MRVNTNELAGSALDWAVAIATGIPATDLRLPKYKGDGLFRYLRDEDGELTGSYMTGPDLLFSRKWEAGGPIIEREGIAIEMMAYGPPSQWHAAIEWLDQPSYTETGPTPLIAAMRCYVASKLGNEIEIPDELLPHP